MEYLGTTDLELVNEGYEPTFLTEKNKRGTSDRGL
jgi:hypothetical protein